MQAAHNSKLHSEAVQVEVVKAVASIIAEKPLGSFRDWDDVAEKTKKLIAAFYDGLDEAIAKYANK